jgi:hypothetical protein
VAAHRLRSSEEQLDKLDCVLFAGGKRDYRNSFPASSRGPSRETLRNPERNTLPHQKM